jgi:hypothetical protein
MFQIYKSELWSPYTLFNGSKLFENTKKLKHIMNYDFLSNLRGKRIKRRKNQYLDTESWLTLTLLMIVFWLLKQQCSKWDEMIIYLSMLNLMTLSVISDYKELNDSMTVNYILIRLWKEAVGVQRKFCHLCGRPSMSEQHKSQTVARYAQRDYVPYSSTEWITKTECQRDKSKETVRVDKATISVGACPYRMHVSSLITTAGKQEWPSYRACENSVDENMCGL